MTNNNNEKRIAIQFYSEVPVSDELWNKLQEEDNNNAIREIANKYGFVLMTDEEANTVPEGTPVIYEIDSADAKYSFYLA